MNKRIQGDSARFVKGIYLRGPEVSIPSCAELAEFSVFSLFILVRHRISRKLAKFWGIAECVTEILVDPTEKQSSSKRSAHPSAQSVPIPEEFQTSVRGKLLLQKPSFWSKSTQFGFLLMQ